MSAVGESVLPIHPACGHRLGSLGCRQHHRGVGEPVPDVSSALIGDAIALTEEQAVQAVEDMLAAGDVEVAGVRDTPAGPRVSYRLTDKGKRRAENLLALPPGALDVADE